MYMCIYKYVFEHILYECVYKLQACPKNHATPKNLGLPNQYTYHLTGSSMC